MFYNKTGPLAFGGILVAYSLFVLKEIQEEN
jgi:hypothetical protein